MAVADELIAVLGFRVEGKGAADDYNKTLDETEKKARGSAANVAAIGKAAGVVATATIAMATKGLTNFASWEERLLYLGNTAGATKDQMLAAGKTVQSMAYDLGLPVDKAVDGLDVLISSGRNLEDAMAFLPSVLQTARASGAATEDIANTANKASGALKLQASDMSAAFDIMVAGGKAGQFELKDMALFIPTIANQFATLGYSGEDGLKRLIAVLQVLRERTGTAGEAATQATNVFSKIFSEQTEKNFKDFGIDLPKEMAAAKAAGEDTLTAFVRLSKQALGGDMSKLPKLFTDLQVQQGMTTLLTAGDSMQRFMDAVSTADVKGGVLRDLQVIIDGTQTSLNRLAETWDGFMKAIGGTVAPPATGVLNQLTGEMNTAKRADEIRAQSGASIWERIGSYGSAGDRDLVAKTDGTGFGRAQGPAPALPTVGASGSWEVAPSQRPASASPAPTAAPEAKASLDLAQFIDPAFQAKKMLLDLDTTVTAKADIDIGPLMSKVEQAKEAIQSLRTMSSGASGSWGAPTPARVVGAGAAP